MLPQLDIGGDTEAENRQRAFDHDDDATPSQEKANSGR